MRPQIASLLAAIVALSLNACSEKSPPDPVAQSKTQSTAAISPSGSAASTKQDSTASPGASSKEAIGPGDLRLGMSTAQRQTTEFLKTATRMPNGFTTDWLYGDLELFGAKPIVKLAIRNDRISQIDLFYSSFTGERTKAILASLDQRYKMIAPSKGEVEDFDAQRTACIAWASKSAPVAFVVRRTEYGRNRVAELSSTVLYMEPTEMKKLVSECGPRAASGETTPKL